LAELTFKVFPMPPATLTLNLNAADSATALRILIEAANSRWEPDALDVAPGHNSICLRLAAPAAALEQLSAEIIARWPGEILSSTAADALWADLREFRWAHPGGPLMKVVLTPGLLPSFDKVITSFGEARVHLSAGGNMAFVSLASNDDLPGVAQKLRGLGLRALTLRGEGPMWPGAHTDTAIMQRVKNALDPENRFPSLEFN
jgi:glycolate oxidase FAD binding subunit